MKRTTQETITPTEYRAFQEAYDFFNAELFDGGLPPVLVTLQRHAKAKGYFVPERFTGRIDDAAAHKLAMNPASPAAPMNPSSRPSLMKWRTSGSRPTVPRRGVPTTTGNGPRK